MNQIKLNADLFVISACESGKGKIVGGEGIVGLVWGIQIAGARSVIASRWSVDDESTSKLMIALHRLLRKGMNKDDALMNAMKFMRGNKQTSHPYYWASFFLMGDPYNHNLKSRSK
jgi:CHAT domain-containing protein